MKTKLLIGLILTTLIFAGNIFAGTKTQITQAQAQKIALKRVNGEVERSETIEKHNKPLYSFFIKDAEGVTTHVLVSEKGKIKRIADETPATAKVE